MAGVTFVVNDDSSIGVREEPHVSEIGLEEAWAVKEDAEAEAWLNSKHRNAEAWGKELIRGGRRLDDFQSKLDDLWLDRKADSRDLKMKLDNIFAGAYGSLLQGAVERAGTAQGAMANLMTYDTQRVAEDVVEAGMAGVAQTNQATYAAESVKALEKLYSTLGVIEATMASLSAQIAGLKGNG